MTAKKKRKTLKRPARKRKTSRAKPLVDRLDRVGKPIITVMALESVGEQSGGAIVLGAKLGKDTLKREVCVVLGNPRQFKESLDAALHQVRHDLLREYAQVVRGMLNGDFDV